jgi:hypothetical protein
MNQEQANELKTKNNEKKRIINTTKLHWLGRNGRQHLTL